MEPLKFSNIILMMKKTVMFWLNYHHRNVRKVISMQKNLILSRLRPPRYRRRKKRYMAILLVAMGRISRLRRKSSEASLKNSVRTRFKQ